jgi:two-component system phosphate regulon sensor histidine kinase PhoR
VLSFDALAARIERALCDDGARCVPLLVFDAGRSAGASLEKTEAAFYLAARRILRAGDLAGDARETGRFAVALLAPARAAGHPGPAEARAALERIAAAISLPPGRRVDAGWWPIRQRAEVEAFARTIEAALERGTRERERSTMFATVGHELRTPLTSIRGYIETLLDEELDPATARRFLETARREALRLGRLVEGMLEFSMLDVTAADPDSRCDAGEQIRAAIDATIPMAKERNFTIRAVAPDGIEARIDADACMHALVNLIENAIKYGRRGGVVELSCAIDRAWVRIAVDDDGPGIEPSEREAVFRMGVRGSRTAARPGTGIGLAVVEAIVRRAGGDVTAERSALGGARFVVRLMKAQRGVGRDKAAPPS